MLCPCMHEEKQHDDVTLETLLDMFLKEEIDRVRASLARRDPFLDRFSSIVSVGQSALDGKDNLFNRVFPALLRTADLTVVESDKNGPCIFSSPLEHVKRGSWENLPRLPSGDEQKPVGTYGRPVWVVFDGMAQRILFVDHVWDTSSASFAERRCRFMAATLSAVDRLSQDPTSLPWPRTAVGMAIIDCSDRASDPMQGVYRVSEIDQILGTTGLGRSLNDVLCRFQDMVQEELEKAAAESGSEAEAEAEAETGFWLDFPLRLYDPEDE